MAESILSPSMLLVICAILTASGIVNGEDETATCIKQVDSCTCQTDTGYINLHPLDRAIKDGKPKFYQIPADQGLYTYSYNPCSPFTSDAGTACHNVSLCQVETLSKYSYPIGTQESAKFHYDSQAGQFIKYDAANYDATRTSFVKLLCDPHEDGMLSAQGESQPTVYEFTLRTRYACVNKTVTTTATTMTTSQPTPSPDVGCQCLILVTVIVVISVLVILVVYYYIKVRTARLSTRQQHVVYLVDKTQQQQLPTVTVTLLQPDQKDVKAVKM